MPRYDFRCEDCGEKFEVQCSWRDKDKVSCPKCGARKVEEIFRGVFSFLTSGASGGDCGSTGCGSGFGGFG